MGDEHKVATPEHDVSDSIEDQMIRAMAHRLSNGGRHLHHRDCIHNLPPEDQAALRRRTPEEYVALHGAMPVQITPDDWEIESPFRAESSGPEPAA